MDIDCLAGAMAHEATHSWVESKIESNLTTGGHRESSYIPAEEVFANEVASKRFGDPYGLLADSSKPNQYFCEQITNSSCSNPGAILEKRYGIDLSDIVIEVFGN
jgi:hypothetical protein